MKGHSHAKGSPGFPPLQFGETFKEYQWMNQVALYHT
jgi:hypothetical protein